MFEEDYFSYLDEEVKTLDDSNFKVEIEIDELFLNRFKRFKELRAERFALNGNPDKNSIEFLDAELLFIAHSLIGQLEYLLEEVK